MSEKGGKKVPLTLVLPWFPVALSPQNVTLSDLTVTLSEVEGSRVVKTGVVK